MSERIIVPERCLVCPFSEKINFIIQCKFYNRGYQADGGDFPEYCRVRKIVVVEGDEDTAEG